MDASRSESSWRGLLVAVAGVMVGPGFCCDGQTNWIWMVWLGAGAQKAENRTDMRIGFGIGIGCGDQSRLCRMEAAYTTIDNRGRDASRHCALR